MSNNTTSVAPPAPPMMKPVAGDATFDYNATTMPDDIIVCAVTKNNVKTAKGLDVMMVCCSTTEAGFDGSWVSDNATYPNAPPGLKSENETRGQYQVCILNNGAADKGKWEECVKTQAPSGITPESTCKTNKDYAAGDSSSASGSPSGSVSGTATSNSTAPSTTSPSGGASRGMDRPAKLVTAFGIVALALAVVV